jgi:hypothetical protein
MKKNLLITMIICFLITSVNPLVAQQSDKQLKKQLKSRAIRQARKEAKKLKKQGYYLAPGEAPLDKTLELAWKYKLQMDDDGYPKYIFANGIVVAETQTAAKVQAYETAKLELAGKIATNTAALIKSNIVNQQLNAEEAASITKIVAVAKNMIAQKIGRVITLVELYKKVGKGIEVNIRIAYNSEIAYEIAKNVIRKKLEEETDLLQEELDKITKF